MITKEAIEAAARAACEDNVQRIHKAAHDGGCSASMSGSEYYMYPPHGWPDFLASTEAGITAALAAMPAGVRVNELEWVEDRYGFRAKDRTSAANAEYSIYETLKDGWKLGGVLVGTGSTSTHASLKAAKAAAQADYEARILTALTPAPDLASENERLRAALEFYANAKNYDRELVVEECGCCSYWHDEKIGREGDQGEIARAALERT